MTVAGGTPDGGGVYHAQINDLTKTDGLEHSYRFYSRGTDGGGKVEAAPAAPDGVIVTAQFAPAPHFAPFDQSPLVAFIGLVPMLYLTFLASGYEAAKRKRMKQEGLAGKPGVDTAETAAQ